MAASYDDDQAFFPHIKHQGLFQSISRRNKEEGKGPVRAIPFRIRAGPVTNWGRGSGLWPEQESSSGVQTGIRGNATNPRDRLFP